MKLIVNPHKIEIQKTPVNEREIDITKCEFEFADEITNDYIKEAYFTFNAKTYKQIIINNECNIPSEVLVEKGQVEIGVVAYKVENEEEIKRYNPSPAYFNTWEGSLKDNAENADPITPTQFEQYMQAMNDGLDEVANVNIDAGQEDDDIVVTITNRYGETKSVKIYAGSDGRGIVSITLTSSTAGTDIYTILYTDGTTQDFSIIKHLEENEVKTVNLDTQIINKIKNLAYGQNATMTKNQNLSYTSTTNKYIYPISSANAITLTPGIYFVATKVLVSEMSNNTYFYLRQGMRRGNSDYLVGSVIRQDAKFDNRINNDDLNVYKWCYGFSTISGEDSVSARNMLVLVNTTETNPLNVKLRIEETYCIRVSEVSEDNFNNCFDRISNYNFQETYPILNLVNYDIENICKNVKNEIATITTNIDKMLIPSYLITPLNNVISEFNPAAKSLSLIFQTDLHSNLSGSIIQHCATSSVKASNYLMERLPISLNILGGDYIANGQNTTKKQAIDYMQYVMNLIDSKSICLRGNHDCNQLQQTSSEILTDLEVFNVIGKKFLINNYEIHTNNNIASPLYGYIDYPFQKIRVVFINTSDGYDQNLKIGVGNINTTQLQWLADNAFDLTGKEDYQVIVFGHYPIYNFDDEESTVEEGRLAPLKQLVLAFKNGSNLNYTTAGDNYKVVKDFTSQGAKTLIAYVCGHIHDDRSILTTDGVLQIATTNAGSYNKESNINTYNEFAFDIINIDPLNNILNFKRIGYGNDRSFTY